MDLEEIEKIIQGELPDADVTVTQPRGSHDDDHLGVRVVSPAFTGKSLVEQHQLVYEALGDLVTREIHAVELETRTPDEVNG